MCGEGRLDLVQKHPARDGCTGLEEPRGASCSEPGPDRTTHFGFNAAWFECGGQQGPNWKAETDVIKAKVNGLRVLIDFVKLL